MAGEPLGRGRGEGDSRSRPRLDGQSRIGLLVLALVTALALQSLIQTRDPGEAAVALEKGVIAESQGRYADAISSFATAHLLEPRSILAALHLACNLERVDHDDEATSYLQGALFVGAPWGMTGLSDCFANAPALYGLDILRVDPAVFIYIRPHDGDERGIQLENIAKDRASDKDAKEALIAMFCLNHRANYRILAAVNLTMALNDQGEIETRQLVKCLQQAGAKYVFTTQDGIQLFFPEDYAERAYLPADHS